jgi:hypothetical protein
MATFKVIKKTDFNTNGVSGTVYTLGVQGRAVKLSSLSFADMDADTLSLDATGTHLTVKGEIEVRKTSYTNQLGENVHGLEFMPKFGFSLSDI